MAEHKTVLHVGSGLNKPGTLHPAFASPEWKVLRLDADPESRPDFIADIRDMRLVATESMDGLFSSGDLVRLPPHHVSRALDEFRRVLRPGGLAVICVPDLQQAAALVAEDKAEEALYSTPQGPVTPLDLIYGHRAALAGGDLFSMHRIGFTASGLATALAEAGFGSVDVARDPEAFSLWATVRRGASRDAGAEAPAAQAGPESDGPFGG